jgi:uncharacterized OB-fold protein
LAEEKTKVPIKEGLFYYSPSGVEPPHLIGCKCQKCGQTFFPAKLQCPRCSSKEMKEVSLSSRGKLYSYTVIYQAPPGYVGKTPYAVGKVQLPERERVLAPLVEVEPSQLKVGMEMELVVGKAYEDPERGEVFTYQFRPYKGGKG